jgi:hypothetical protein
VRKPWRQPFRKLWEIGRADPKSDSAVATHGWLRRTAPPRVSLLAGPRRLLKPARSDRGLRRRLVSSGAAVLPQPMRDNSQALDGGQNGGKLPGGVDQDINFGERGAPTHFSAPLRLSRLGAGLHPRLSSYPTGKSRNSSTLQMWSTRPAATPAFALRASAVQVSRACAGLRSRDEANLPG